MDKNELLNKIRENVVTGMDDKIRDACRQGLDAGIPAEDILDKALLKGMNEVGDLFSKGEYFIPELLVAERAMKAGIAVLEPELVKKPSKSLGKIVIGTVAGDLHDIGKNLAAIMISAAGFEVVDLGTDVTAEKFMQAARQNNARAVGLSALLTTTMINMGPIIKSLRGAGFKGLIIIGGAPITQGYADSIGADFYASDAVDGARKLKKAITRQ